MCLLWLLVLAATMFVPLRARRIALTLLQRLVQVAGLAAVIASGVYLVWPAAAPECFTSALAPLSDYLARWLGEPYRPFAWPVAATAVTLIAAPLSITIGFVRKLDSLGALVRRVAAGTWRPAGGNTADGGSVIRGVLAGHDEFDEAVRSMTAAATERPRQPRRRKLAEILDQ